MDKRLFLLLLGLSLLLGFLQALRCHKCPYVKLDGSCATQRTICHARDKEECMLKKYYGGGKLLLGFQDCQYMCSNRTSLRDLITVISCCKDRDFCNTF